MDELEMQMKADHEHKAWLTFVQEFRNLTGGVDLNDAKCDRMVRAIRVQQSDVVREITRMDALGNYLATQSN